MPGTALNAGSTSRPRNTVCLHFLEFGCYCCECFDFYVEHRQASQSFSYMDSCRVFSMSLWRFRSWRRCLMGCPAGELIILPCVYFWSCPFAFPISWGPLLASRCPWGDFHPAFIVLCLAVGMTLCPFWDIPYDSHCWVWHAAGHQGPAGRWEVCAQCQPPMPPGLEAQPGCLPLGITVLCLSVHTSQTVAWLRYLISGIHTQ